MCASAALGDGAALLGTMGLGASRRLNLEMPSSRSNRPSDARERRSAFVRESLGGRVVVPSQWHRLLDRGTPLLGWVRHLLAFLPSARVRRLRPLSSCAGVVRTWPFACSVGCK